MTVVIYDGLAGLPHFNPDLEGDEPLPPVSDLRARLAAADGLLVSIPEYAHGVPGSFKNALDWIVSTGELRDKPVLLINASPGGGERAQTSLIDTLQTIEARVLVEATVVVPSVRTKIDSLGNVSDAGTVVALRNGLDALAAAIRNPSAGGVAS